MDLQLKNKFLEKWRKYFGNSPLPITFFYSDKEFADAKKVIPKKGWSCIIAELAKVRNGESLSYNAVAVICGGGKRYLGFSKGMRPDFEFFLSCGIPDKMEGERYKQTPEIVLETQKHLNIPDAYGKNIVFKRWDMLTEDDDPEVVIFFAKPDVLSGLFTLANFDTVEPNSVFTPFSSGCGSIIHYPYLEIEKSQPKAVIGMFDVSARPFVQKNTLTFALPMKRFEQLIENMDESFLITHSWEIVKKRIDYDKD
jgi:uncharacterized protein (DUF169 family)